MDRNYVGLLNEHAQKKGWTVRFDLVHTDGPDHIKKFTMRAVMNNRVYPEGVGRNKKEAKQNAAMNAFNSLEDNEPVNTETSLCTSASISAVSQANFICWLNEYAHKKRLSFTPVETTKMTGFEIQMCSYACKYVCGDTEFPEATANSKKEAKEAAARLVYELLTEQEKEQVLDQNGNEEENPNTQNLSTILHHIKLCTPADTENTTADKNYVGLLNEYCQKSKQVHDYKAVERRGPEHVPEFVYKVIINQRAYPEGRGRTVKEAKKKAAQLALHELHELSSQISSLSSMSESADDVSSSQKISENQSKSQSIVFADSAEPEPQPFIVKPKRQLAANFQNSPVSNNKEQAGTNALKMAKPSEKSATVSSQSAKSKFLEEFDNNSITKIGTGGFGRVFKARRKLEDTIFAVKIVKFNKKALREVRELSNLVHPNIVRYHTCWTEETAYRDEASETLSTSSSDSGSESLYIQMEFCEGETVRQWIEERNNHPKKYPKRRQEAADIIKQVLEAVKYIHNKKLFHRDLKPANIMFGQDGGVKVGDFGLVSKEEGEDDASLLERTKRAGTRTYMSPEQRHHQVYGRKVDIYAVGLIYFELLWYFGTQTERQKQWEDIRSKRFPDEFSKRFDFEHKLIEQMLHENPDKRPEAKYLLKELDQHAATMAATEHNVHKENRTY